MIKPQVVYREHVYPTYGVLHSVQLPEGHLFVDHEILELIGYHKHSSLLKQVISEENRTTIGQIRKQYPEILGTDIPHGRTTLCNESGLMEFLRAARKSANSPETLDFIENVFLLEVKGQQVQLTETDVLLQKLSELEKRIEVLEQKVRDERNEKKEPKNTVTSSIFRLIKRL